MNRDDQVDSLIMVFLEWILFLSENAKIIPLQLPEFSNCRKKTILFFLLIQSIF